VYFSPWCNGDEHHGEVLRYDTFGDFDEVSSWGAYDPGDDGVGEHPDGFAGAVFDGRYVYFVPLHAPLVQFHREVLRYDTSGDFFAAASWSTMEPDVGGEGYAGAVFDGRFVYFGPNNWSEAHGEVLRYDAAAEFTDPFAWVAYNPGQNGVGYDPRGYSGIVYDGRRVYFVPGAKAHNAQYHGEVLRYDTAAGWAPDCNNNGIPDACDIADGTSDDQNGNGIPDECEVWPVLPSDLEPAEPASPAEAKPLPPGP
jgi:hypothetical protein